MSEAPALRPAYLGVQALRGIAACMVVVNHATALWWVDFGGIKPFLWNNGAAGVDLFFVISGFVIALSAARDPDAPRFFGRRLVRIFPLYWVVTLVTLAKLYAVQLRPGLQGIGPHYGLCLGYIVGSCFLIPVRTANGWVEPIVAPGWTLSFEIFFYLLFAVALAAKIRPLRLLTPVLLVLAVAGLWQRPAWPAITTLLNPILLEFLAGVWLGNAVRSGLRLQTSTAAALGLFGFAVLMTAPPGHFPGGRLLIWGVSATLILLAAVMLEARFGSRIPAWLLHLGDASYSIYLTHDLAILVVARYFLVRHIAKPNEWMMAVASLLLSVAVGLAVYRWVERPLTLAAGRWTGWGAPRIATGTREEAVQH